MRSSKPTLRESFFARLGFATPIRQAPMQRLEHVREYMVNALMLGAASGAANLARRILNTTVVGVLWYCRTDLMQGRMVQFLQVGRRVAEWVAQFLATRAEHAPCVL